MDEFDAKDGYPGPSVEQTPVVRILVVEDNQDMRDFLRRVLVPRGFQLSEATDGVSAVSIARQEKPDLILMDLSLPGMDGLEATRQLKADPGLRHIPIVAVTARARAADEADAREAGCDAYISKPYGLDAFLDVIRTFILEA